MAQSSLVTVILVTADVEVPYPHKGRLYASWPRGRSGWIKVNLQPNGRQRHRTKELDKGKRQKGTREGKLGLQGRKKKQQREMEWEGAGAAGAGLGPHSPDRRRTRW